MKSKGSKNYFSGLKLYGVRDVVPYIERFEPSINVPHGWTHGGTLNKMIRDMGIKPDVINGSRQLYTSVSMYKIAKLLIEKLKKQQNRHVIKTAKKKAVKAYEPTPIEALANEASEAKTGDETKKISLDDARLLAAEMKIKALTDEVVKLQTFAKMARNLFMIVGDKFIDLGMSPEYNPNDPTAWHVVAVKKPAKSEERANPSNKKATDEDRDPWEI